MKSKGNILIIFVMLIGLSFIIFTITNIVTTNLGQSRIKMAESNAFYVAEAGISKATWYLATLPVDGGKGKEWRGSTSEAYGPGSFEVTVLNTALSNEVSVISTGEVHEISRTIMQSVNIEAFPDAFDYSFFCGNSDAEPSGAVVISGDMFVNGNTDMGGSSQVTDGEVYHPEGYTVSGNAEDGGVPEPVPAMPSLDTSYYDGEILIAEGYAPGDQTYTDLDLSGGTVYVNGDVSITGTGNITGPGTLVATGKITITGNPEGDDSGIEFISKGETEISGGPDLDSAIFYSREDFTASGNVDVLVGSIITSADIRFSGSMNFTGLIYCAGAARLTGDPNISGILLTNSFDKLTGSVNITYNSSVLPPIPPTGIESGDPEPIKGTWQEI